MNTRNVVIIAVVVIAAAVAGGVLWSLHAQTVKAAEEEWDRRARREEVRREASMVKAQLVSAREDDERFDKERQEATAAYRESLHPRRRESWGNQLLEAGERAGKRLIEIQPLERPYIMWCRECATALACEQDRKAAERPETRTHRSFTYCE